MRRSRMGYWPVALEGVGSNCFSVTQLVGQKGNHEAKKWRLKKHLFGEKNERETDESRYSMTVTNSPLVA